MNTLIKIIIKVVILLLFFSITVSLSAVPDVLVGFRFYKGIKTEAEPEVSVITAYHLKPLFVGNIVSRVGVSQEREELKRIFNLKDLELMNNTQWAWREKNPEKRFQVIILNGHEFEVRLSLTQSPDTFQAEVNEKGKPGNKSLLDTEIVLPQKKTAVFGFEDSHNKPYFISFHRQPDLSVIREEPDDGSGTGKPKLIKKVDPAYPVVALKAGIEGRVLLEAVTDEKGNVINAIVLSGHPLLRVAALRAVKKWKYEPLEVKDKAVSATFTVKVYFKLPESVREELQKKKKAVAEPIHMNLKNADLLSVLDLFEKLSRCKINVDKGITGKVTCNFKNMPWDKAMRLILEANNLKMKRTGNTIHIFKSGASESSTQKMEVLERTEEDPELEFSGEPISINLKEADLYAVFQFIGKLAGIKVKVDSGISGSVSLNMKKVPWDKALNIILETNHLYLLKESSKLIRIRKVAVDEEDTMASIPDIWPTAGYLSDSFGWRTHPFTKKRSFHRGMDIAAESGSKVLAAADGEVFQRFNNKLCGNVLMIDHKNGYVTRYTQLKSFNVNVGDIVKKGDLIGLVGSSGRSTGPHLHWEVHLNGKPINPITMVKY